MMMPRLNLTRIHASSRRPKTAWFQLCVALTVYSSLPTLLHGQSAVPGGPVAMHSAAIAASDDFTFDDQLMGNPYTPKHDIEAQPGGGFISENASVSGTETAESTNFASSATNEDHLRALFCVPTMDTGSGFQRTSFQKTAENSDVPARNDSLIYRPQAIHVDGSRRRPGVVQPSGPVQAISSTVPQPNPGNFMVLQAPVISENGPAAAGVSGTPLPLAAQSATGTNGPAVAVADGGEASGQSAADIPLTADVIAARRATCEQRADLPEDVKAGAVKHFQRASELIAQKADAEKRTTDLKAEKDNGPTLIGEWRSQLSQAPSRADPEIAVGSTVTELDQLRLADEEKLGEVRRNLETWETKARLRAERKPQMPALIETTRKQLEDAQKAVAGVAPEGENPVLGLARRTEQESLVLLLRAQLEMYRAEQIRYEALTELFPLQRDILTRSRNVLDKRVELWKAVLADARRNESARQAREAREKLRNAHPTLRDLAEHNSTLTLRRKALQESMSTRVTELSVINDTLSRIEEKFENVTEKENRAGLTTAIGLLLRSQRNQLPYPGQFLRQQQQAEEDIVRLQTEQMQLQDERNELGDIETHIELNLRPIDSKDATAEELLQMAHELLTDRRKYLDDLLTDYDAALQTLGETDVTCRRLLTVTGEFASYIDERVLWIRSAAAVDPGFFSRTLQAAQSVLGHRQWGPLFRFLTSDLRASWPLYACLLLVFAVLTGLERRARVFIAQLGVTAQRQKESGIPQTLLATGLTVLMASEWPAVLWFTGWRIDHCELGLARAISEAFTFCAATLWLVNSLRGLCRRNGVAESFLEWPEAVVRSLYSNLVLYIAGGLPLSFIVVVAEKLDDGIYADSIGRVAFVCFCVLLSAILRKITRPTGPVIGNLLQTSPGSLMNRLRFLWSSVAVGAPLFLAVLSLMGYLYTAEQLMMRLQLTLGLSISLLITYTMLMQWMLVAKRRLALRQARARRAAALAAAQREADNDGAATSPIPPVEIPQVDLSLLNQQMLRLVRGTACVLFLSISWAIWSQVLPALQVFSRIELWQIVVETTEKIDSAGEGSVIREFTRVTPVTLGHLLLGLGVFVVAILASRNVPGLLELAVLQRLPLDHGGRNAVTTLCRYGFMLTGIIVASNTIGVSWGSVQWLVAALTVGLGFGLQEIFANFVSGLIILFERPVRIGDVVTIDGVSGAVSRIQIRATTITDWDRKEYIVPNKEFVTGKLLNWTLSDKTNRVVIQVGVAYGTDIEHALTLLQQIAEQNPLVLEDPPPVVGFEGFGDSTLNLVLRCYLPNLDHRLKVITQLHLAIDREFRAARIEIAFPQRELHIRSMPSTMAAALSSQQHVADVPAIPPEIGADNLPEHQFNEQRRSA